MKVAGGLLFGIFLGYIFQIPVDEKISAIIIMSAFDSIFGGIVAKLNLNFSDTILISGFFTNLIFAFTLIFLGNFFKIELYYIALLIFGLRIFKNLSTAKGIFLKNLYK
jgi:small basic protein